MKNQKGRICLNLFAGEKGFPTESQRAIAYRCIAATQSSISATFDQLPLSRYAIAVIHDASHNGKLNTGFLGIPKGGFGFSQNLRIGTSAPKFFDTAFSVSG